jgi:hypothetical protein
MTARRIYEPNDQYARAAFFLNAFLLRRAATLWRAGASPFA